MAINKIWVYAEASGERSPRATLEMLTKARELGRTVEAVYVGTEGDAVAAQCGEYGATTLYAVDPGKGLPGHGAAALAAARRRALARRGPVRAELRRS